LETPEDDRSLKNKSTSLTGSEIMEDKTKIHKGRRLCYRMGNLKIEKKDIIAEISKIDTKKETIKSKHPEVKEHIEKYWMS